MIRGSKGAKKRLIYGNPEKKELNPLKKKNLKKTRKRGNLKMTRKGEFHKIYQIMSDLYE